MRVGIEILDRREFDPEVDGVEGAEYKVRIELPEGSAKFRLKIIEGEWIIEGL